MSRRDSRSNLRKLCEADTNKNLSQPIRNLLEIRIGQDIQPGGIGLAAHDHLLCHSCRGARQRSWNPENEAEQHPDDKGRAG
jgi:hypothetical protein